MTPDRDYDELATAPIPVLLRRPRWRDTFSALQIYNYRLYVSAQLLANTSGWAMRIAMDWLVFELTSSITLVGIIVALQFGPMLILGPIGGVIADRFNKRRLLMLAYGVNIVISTVLAIVTLTGHVELWHVYSAALALGLTAVVDAPARSVFVNEMVGHGRLGNAISINASIFHLGGLLGPAISGVLIAWVGAGWAIATYAIAAVAFVVTLLAMRTAELLPSVVAQRAKGQIREGWAYVVSKPTIFWPVVIAGFVAMFGMNLPVVLVAFANNVYDSGAAGYGLYSSAAAAGALAGALTSTRRMTHRLRTIILSAGLFGLAITATGLAPVVGVFLICITAIGFTRLLFATAAESLVQMSSNRAIRGRVMANYVMVVLGGQAIGGPLVGALAEWWGVKTTMIVCGAVPTIAAIVIAILLARSGRLSLKVRWGWKIVPLKIEVS